MTQASLSPDLHPALRTTMPRPKPAAHTGATSEAALWIIALTSTGLVLASLMLLGLLSQNVVSDASVGGFVSGVTIMIAALGVGALTYVLVTARREGYLGSTEEPRTAAATATPGGMHVVPAVPADLARRKRRELLNDRSVRSRQAKAIATAAAVSSKPRAAAPQSPARRPVAIQAPARIPVAAQRIAPPPMPVRVVRVTQPRPATARPAPGRPIPARPMRPTRPVARAQPLPRPAIRMPRPQVRGPRPTAWPMTAPVMRMAAPRVHPHSQAALFQVNAANVRTPPPPYHR